MTREEAEIEANRVLDTPDGRRALAEIEAGAPDEEEAVTKPMGALLDAVFRLGAWAGRDLTKQFAARVVMRLESRSVRHFAAQARVSQSYIRRMIRQARQQIGSAAQG